MDCRVSTKEIKVRNYHIDSYQHVNNMRYMEFLEEARWSHFENNASLEVASQEETAFVIANYNINYLYPATMNQVLEIKTRVAKIGTKSLTFEHEIFIKGTDKKALAAEVTLVSFDIKSQRPKEIKDSIKVELVK
ncbi:acyl-CoA thioesterase [Flammeovirga agarivorans]|uniref:Acyl-CoA thioesterase n=1 Tax=Flammeovirga agarivorans TaxID=2726742 RepID=A0A7X8XUY1_9BACT|nr:thioesterase family protein [Flammeovirga agarivorans]NLR90827.1 acyl-CoA thioesterase [Flammeovirga agarivorans]